MVEQMVGQRNVRAVFKQGVGATRHKAGGLVHLHHRRRLRHVEAQHIILRAVRRVKRAGKAGVIAQGKRHHLAALIFHLHTVHHAGALQRIGAGKAERKRKLFHGEHIGLQAQGNVRFALFHQGMFHIARKAVLAALIAHAAVCKRAAPQPPAIGEQNGRMAPPYGGIAPPHQLAPGGLFPNADKLGPLGGHHRLQKFVFQQILHPAHSFAPALQLLATV